MQNDVKFVVVDYGCDDVDDDDGDYDLDSLDSDCIR